MLAQVPYQELCSSDGQRLHQNDEKCLDETSALRELLGGYPKNQIKLIFWDFGNEFIVDGLTRLAESMVSPKR